MRGYRGFVISLLVFGLVEVYPLPREFQEDQPNAPIDLLDAAEGDQITNFIGEHFGISESCGPKQLQQYFEKLRSAKEPRGNYESLIEYAPPSVNSRTPIEVFSIDELARLTRIFLHNLRYFMGKGMDFDEAFNQTFLHNYHLTLALLVLFKEHCTEL